MEIPELVTPRLRLRAPCGADFPVHRDFYADAEASRFYGGPLPANRAWTKLASDLGHWRLRGYGMWSIERRNRPGMVGSCGLVWPEGWPRSELTWWIMPEARRQGIAREASLAVIDHALEILGWTRVETHMDDANIAARRLAESLGGRVIAREAFPDGLTRDVFALSGLAAQTG